MSPVTKGREVDLSPHDWAAQGDWLPNLHATYGRE
jgi:hypothetical protein